MLWAHHRARIRKTTDSPSPLTDFSPDEGTNATPVRRKTPFNKQMILESCEPLSVGMENRSLGAVLLEVIFERLPLLLGDPHSGGTLCDVEVQNASTVMADDEEAIRHMESNSWNREKIYRCDGFAVVSKKGEPPYGRLGISRRPAHPAGGCSLRDSKTEHQKLAMDARCSPGWILASHPEDQLSNLLECLPSSNLIPDSGNQSPIQTKASPVPPDHRFGPDDDEILSPS